MTSINNNFYDISMNKTNLSSIILIKILNIKKSNNMYTFKFFTSFPSLTTTPEDSWPIIIGSRTTKSPILPFTK